SHGDAALHAKLVNATEKARSSSDYYAALFALMAFPQPEYAQEVLAMVDNGKLRQQDYPAIFATLLSNPSTREVTWTYMKSHWDTRAEKATSFGGRGAVSALGDACSPQMRDDIKQFFSNHRAPGAELALKQSLDRIDACLAFKQLQQKSMEHWLAGK